MTVLEKKLVEFKKVANQFEKLRNAILDTGIAEFEFKQNLYDHAVTEREMGKINATVFGGWQFKNEPDYEKNYLMPILENLTKSPEYITENVELLTEFANSISGLDHHRNQENPQAADAPVATIIYNALLTNEAKSNNIERQIEYTRNIAEILPAHEKEIFLRNLFETVPESDFEKLSPKARNDYAFCKLWWWIYYCFNDTVDDEKVISVYDDIKKFIDYAFKVDSGNNDFYRIEWTLRGCRISRGSYLALFCKQTISLNAAKKIFCLYKKICTHTNS